MRGIVVLIAYAALMLGVTAILTKRARSAENFHVADRNIGTVVAAMSIAATWIWAPALFTSAEKAYSNGIPGLFCCEATVWQFGYILFCLSDTMSAAPHKMEFPD